MSFLSIIKSAGVMVCGWLPGKSPSSKAQTSSLEDFFRVTSHSDVFFSGKCFDSSCGHKAGDS
jgi:hypothetical protein